MNTGFFPFVYGGALLRYSRTETYYSIAGASSSVIDTDWAGDVMLGVGADYKFTKGFGLTMKYDINYKLGLGLNFNF